mgnify:CR=1 FL=1
MTSYFLFIKYLKNVIIEKEVINTNVVRKARVCQKRRNDA